MNSGVVCLTEDFKTAREKCVEAQFTSDLNTDETDVERSKSRARRQKNLFQDIDLVDAAAEPLAAPLSCAPTSSVPTPTLWQPPAPPSSLTARQQTASPHTAVSQPPAPPSSLTPRQPTASPHTTASQPPPPPSSLTPRQHHTQDSTELVQSQHGNVTYCLSFCIHIVYW